MILVTRKVFVNTVNKLKKLNAIYTSLYFKYKVDGILCETSIIITSYGCARVDSIYIGSDVLNMFFVDSGLKELYKSIGVGGSIES